MSDWHDIDRAELARLLGTLYQMEQQYTELITTLPLGHIYDDAEVKRLGFEINVSRRILIHRMQSHIGITPFEIQQAQP